MMRFNLLNKKFLVFVSSTLILAFMVIGIYNKPFPLPKAYKGRKVEQLETIDARCLNLTAEKACLSRFLSFTKKLNLLLILIDPLLLRKSLCGSDARKLKNYRFYNDAKNDSNLIVLGLNAVENALKTIQSANKNLLNQFNPVEVLGKNRIEGNSNFNEESSLIPIHYFYKVSNCVVQVVLFYKNFNFYWTGAIQDPNFKFDNLHFNELTFGKHEMAFDNFDIFETFISKSEKVFVPKDPVAFLGQLSTAKFIECNLSISEEFKKKYGKDQRIAKSKVMNAEKTVESLSAMKSFMSRHHMEFWLSAGTLLGWYRQCGVISYTSDIDFETWSAYASYDLESDFYSNPEGITLGTTFGYPHKAFELALYKGYVSNDLFFVDELKGQYATTLHISRKGWYWLMLPKFRLCSAELLGYKVLVPCNPEEVLIAAYGPKWMVPDTNFHWLNSPKNKGEFNKWNEEEAQNCCTFWSENEMFYRIMIYIQYSLLCMILVLLVLTCGKHL